LNKKHTNENPNNLMGLDQLRHKVVNYALVSFSILGSITWLLLVFISFRDEFTQFFEIIIYTAAIVVLVLSTLLRHRLSLLMKIFIITSLITIVVTTNFHSFGFFANTKIFVGIFPIFLSFILPFRKSLAFLLFLLLIHAIYGYFYSTGILEYHFDMEAYGTKGSTWVIGITIIIYASLGLLFTGHFFNNALIHNFTLIENQNLELQENEKKYRLLFETSNDAIVLISDNKYQSCNSKTFALFGGDESYILNKPPWEISPQIQPNGQPSEKMAKAIFAAAFRGEAQLFEWQHMRCNGELFDVSISLNALELNNTLYVQAVLRDITDKKHTENELKLYRTQLEQMVVEKTNDLLSLNEELRAINDELQTKNEIISSQKNELEKTLVHLQETQKKLIHSEKMAALGVLTSGIAHEINNPLNFINGGVTGLQMEVNNILAALHRFRELQMESSNEKEKELFETIETEFDIKQSVANIPGLMDSVFIGIDRTIQIVRGLRTFSRLDDENKHLANLTDLIESSLTILYNKYKNRITLKTSFCKEDQISCYPGKLGQLFVNLIMNAIQAIEGQGTITITTAYLADKKQFTITIADTGVGIPEPLHQKIFDPFYTTKPVGEGTGLGLSIVHGIINDHQGSISMESKQGEGTVFTIFLPKS
jgi:PAS domain S-box-containing protein